MVYPLRSKCSNPEEVNQRVLILLLLTGQLATFSMQHACAAHRRFQCNVCGMFTDVPMDYFCALDQNGQRHDIGNHPELTQGSVEYLAPQEYMVRVPSSPLGCTCQSMTFLCFNVCMSAASALHSEACSAALNHPYSSRNGRTPAVIHHCCAVHLPKGHPTVKSTEASQSQPQTKR